MSVNNWSLFITFRQLLSMQTCQIIASSLRKSIHGLMVRTGRRLSTSWSRWSLRCLREKSQSFSRDTASRTHTHWPRTWPSKLSRRSVVLTWEWRYLGPQSSQPRRDIRSLAGLILSPQVVLSFIVSAWASQAVTLSMIMSLVQWYLATMLLTRSS